VSPRRWKERIQDILDAADEIQDFTHGMDFQTFQNDVRTLKAVELDFIVIGEAANQIPAEVEDHNPQVPWQLMRSMRNRLVHVYFSVSAQMLWDTIQNDLPALLPSLEALLKEK
jgi:uncharacterized protein with HEPN domain